MLDHFCQVVDNCVIFDRLAVGIKFKMRVKFILFR